MLSEQFVHRALKMADNCVILTRGRVGWAGPASEAGQEVLDRYLGEAEPDCPPWWRDPADSHRPPSRSAGAVATDPDGSVSRVRRIRCQASVVTREEEC